MKVLDFKMERRVGGLERHFRDGISRLLIDNGDEWGGDWSHCWLQDFCLANFQEWQQRDRRFEMREKENKFDIQNRVHPGGNIWSTIRNIDWQPRRELGKRFRFRGCWSRLTWPSKQNYRLRKKETQGWNLIQHLHLQEAEPGKSIKKKKNWVLLFWRKKPMDMR